MLLLCFVVKVLHSVFNNASGTQQDVSEFTHKLLEWMEDAFSQSLPKEQLVEIKIFDCA